MKKYLLLLFFVLGLNGAVHCQIFADPAIEQVFFTDLNGIPIDDTMPLGYVARLNVPIRNLNNLNGLPPGSCKLKIGLGTKLILQPGFNLTVLPSSQYFRWTSEINSGQVQLTGELVNAIPPGYRDTAQFNVQGSVLEYSTITANFLVTNHNTPVVLSDEDPSNNTAFRLYKIIPVVIPVNFRFVTASNDSCRIHVHFGTENEINVKEYQVEYSTNGRDFRGLSVIKAAGQTQYSSNIPLDPALRVPVLFIRIRSTDYDGKSKLSNTTTVNGNCSSAGTLLVYPNPVFKSDIVNIRFMAGLPAGPYRLSLLDIRGRLIQNNHYNIAPPQTLTYKLGIKASGEYLLQITSLFTGKSEVRRITIL